MKNAPPAPSGARGKFHVFSCSAMAGQDSSVRSGLRAVPASEADRYEQTEGLEHRRQFSDALGMRVGGLTVGLEIIHGAHVVHLTHASFSRRVHRILIVAHDLRDLLPERFLRLDDLKPAVKTVDARANRLVCRARQRFPVIAGEL
ncbi:hypothetical protein LJ655_15935 [Paraburkholderia sp. MMS20-SJTN17]|uniref:Uncharacterized protein n=1 Tax=Paraburkholderia translucens TaxID=2886945 RepID=A0ABS8KG47_9BURK|nr:hypothetical protein [Paraburkholderia sp. MMS20-SJTN17]MCC8403362.1 hypothetical protein [Paraburkholderia sp. MMS20-SJTN17]